MAAAAEGKNVRLRSSDMELFEVETAVAMQSKTIRGLIEAEIGADGIPLANVSSPILRKVLDYCEKHAVADPKISGAADGDILGSDAKEAEDELKSWDANYIKVDLNTLYDLILAANYMEVKGLLDLCCQTAANMIKGKSPEEIRTTFKIKNDFTPEQEAEIRSKHSWAFE